jgi:hypothetical protein
MTCLYTVDDSSCLSIEKNRLTALVSLERNIRGRAKPGTEREREREREREIERPRDKAL